MAGLQHQAVGLGQADPVFAELLRPEHGSVGHAEQLDRILRVPGITGDAAAEGGVNIRLFLPLHGKAVVGQVPSDLFHIGEAGLGPLVIEENGEFVADPGDQVVVRGIVPQNGNDLGDQHIPDLLPIVGIEYAKVVDVRHGDAEGDHLILDQPVNFFDEPFPGYDLFHLYNPPALYFSTLLSYPHVLPMSILFISTINILH